MQALAAHGFYSLIQNRKATPNLKAGKKEIKRAHKEKSQALEMSDSRQEHKQIKNRRCS